VVRFATHEFKITGLHTQKSRWLGYCPMLFGPKCCAWGSRQFLGVQAHLLTNQLWAQASGAHELLGGYHELKRGGGRKPAEPTEQLTTVAYRAVCKGSIGHYQRTPWDFLSIFGPKSQRVPSQSASESAGSSSGAGREADFAKGILRQPPPGYQGARAFIC